MQFQRKGIALLVNVQDTSSRGSLRHGFPHEEAAWTSHQQTFGEICHLSETRHDWAKPMPVSESAVQIHMKLFPHNQVWGKTVFSHPQLCRPVLVAGNCKCQIVFVIVHDFDFWYPGRTDLWMNTISYAHYIEFPCPGLDTSQDEMLMSPWQQHLHACLNCLHFLAFSSKLNSKYWWWHINRDVGFFRSTQNTK